MFKLELECGEMEIRIITRSIRRQLDQVIIHQEVKNDVAINNNLSADQVDQQFVTPKRVYLSKQGHPWTKDRPTGHRMLEVASIIPCEMQTNETDKCIVICNKIPREKNIRLRMQIHRLSLDEGVENLNLHK